MVRNGLLAMILGAAIPVSLSWGQPPLQTREDATILAASQVLNEIMAIPANRIPAALLADAPGIAIFPGLVKGGFVVGVRHGRGVVVVREEGGAWRAPMFVTLTGGSLGWQVGIQATDVILVFRTRRGLNGLMQGKFTVGADAAVAAGPVGRQAAAATDARLQAEILSYSRSRGLFVGVAIDGAALEIDHAANRAYYAASTSSPGDNQAAQIPPAAVALLEQIARYTTGTWAVPPPAPGAAGPALIAPGPPDERETLRRQLADASRRLQTVLDAPWRQYLALPAELYATQAPPSQEVLGKCLARYDTVATDPRYQRLSHQPDFQATYRLLRSYVSVQTARGTPTLSLPPPPR